MTRAPAVCLLIGLAGSVTAQEHPGAAAYRRVCADCHGREGRGDIAPGIVPLAYDADYLLAIAREGYIEMPPISRREISDDEVRQVAAYLESLTSELAMAGTEAPATRDLSFSAVAFNVADLGRSEKFYTEVLGLERIMRIPAEGKLLEVILAQPGQPGKMNVILAHLNDDPLPEDKAAYGRIVAITPDAEAVARRATDAGYSARNVGSGQPNDPVIIFLEDPDGYQIELYQAPSPAGG